MLNRPDTCSDTFSIPSALSAGLFTKAPMLQQQHFAFMSTDPDTRQVVSSPARGFTACPLHTSDFLREVSISTSSDSSDGEDFFAAFAPEAMVLLERTAAQL